MKGLMNIPKYIWLPLICVLVMNAITYFCTRIITQHMFHFNISTSFDDKIPFIPVFVLFYILAYLQWVIGFLFIALESKKVCYEVLIGEIIAKFCCLVCFVAFPTTLVRPEIDGQGIWEYLVSLIYRIDAADNLFPSIHCLESWICFRGAFYMKKMPAWYKWIMLVFSLCVFASTVCIKQHVAVDMAGAVAVAELGLFLSRKYRLGRIFDALEVRMHKRSTL